MPLALPGPPPGSRRPWRPRRPSCCRERSVASPSVPRAGAPCASGRPHARPTHSPSGEGSSPCCSGGSAPSPS
eukprot:14239895-Alexandrium_andersonii.AAC.1